MIFFVCLLVIDITKDYPLPLKFYPSISEETSNKAINFAENHTSISQENIRIINTAKSPCYFTIMSHGRDKSTTAPLTSQWAKLSEFIGIYIQPLLESSLEKDQMGLYRNGGFIILRNINNQQKHKIRKKGHKYFLIFQFVTQKYRNRNCQKRNK